MSLTLVIGNKNYSSWSLRPWLFLKYHDIAFEEIRIPLYREDSKPKLLSYSPAGKVPTLLDGDIKIWDSLAILEYLAERFPHTQGWPEDIAERALARSLAAEMHSGFTALRIHCGMNCRRTPAAKQLPDAVYADIERISQIWQQCRQQHSTEGPWLFGRFSIVDAMFTPVALRFYSYQLATNPEAQTYINTVLENPAVKAWIDAGKLESEIIPEFE
ncbi:MAG: glutathione S-transferase family protein [Methylococcaceae bacterium]|nr:glutathione S-transferase family protein [Methylococcaceae bacterium]MDZ4155679.1 glutathione S-transferase family protein [Methylococcales bacterium]MDP2392186.1 glutathione S-transferase family protein [Methylococcaceae bacterium]MDP3018628.1 glutathione S-transferase family protein [Methylococcaceae bacterium]MDP3390559.1 glutathione S-transferase family protein [Methylococcaceae bacterium]